MKWTKDSPSYQELVSHCCHANFSSSVGRMTIMMSTRMRLLLSMMVMKNGNILMATMMMLPIGKTVTTTRMMWPQAVKVSASSCSAQPSFALQCAETNTWQGELVYYDFFNIKISVQSVCVVCRSTGRRTGNTREHPLLHCTTLLLLQFHSAGFNFDLLFMCEWEQ